MEDFLEAKRLANKTFGLTEAFSQRLDNLKSLCFMWMKDYYGDINIKGDNKLLEEKKYEEARRQMR